MFFIRSDAEDFWNFVRWCRVAGTTHGHPGSNNGGFYDVVAGPVAKFAQGEVYEGWDQVSFHTARALKLLGPLAIVRPPPQQ